jgi:hypothetical protein
MKRQAVTESKVWCGCGEVGVARLVEQVLRIGHEGGLAMPAGAARGETGSVSGTIMSAVHVPGNGAKSCCNDALCMLVVENMPNPFALCLAMARKED